MQINLRRARGAGRSPAVLWLACLALAFHSGPAVGAESRTELAQAAPERAEQPGPPHAPGQPVETLVFRWPIPSRAEVTVNTVKRGRSLKQRFTLIAEREAGSQDVLVSFRDFRFLELDGQPIDTPERKKALETATALAAAIPSLRIDATGRPIGVAGLDALFETLKKTLLKGLPAEEAEKIKAFLDDPSTRKQAAAGALDNWNAWVGAWLGMPVLPAEGKVDLVTTVFGQSVTQPTVFRNLGKADACPTCIRVQAQGTMSGPEFMRAWSGMMRSMVEQGGGQADGFEDFMKSVEDVRREASYGAVINTTTMQPLTAEKQINMVMNLKGQEPKSQSEGTTFQFDWQAKPRR